jgi:hypothetical protein
MLQHHVSSAAGYATPQTQSPCPPCPADVQAQVCFGPTCLSGSVPASNAKAFALGLLIGAVTGVVATATVIHFAKPTKPVRRAA